MKKIYLKLSITVHIILISLVLFSLAWVFFSSLTFFASDTGLRFLQIRELIAHQWQTFAIDYPAQFLDPDLHHTPYYYAYSLIDNQIYFNISHFLPWLASFLYVALGPIGLSVLPVLGGLLTAVAVYKLGVLMQVKHTRLLLWTAVFGTPVIFYSLELWDHTLAAACATWAVYGVALGLINGRWQSLFWGGVAAGIGLGQRPEMYTFAIALGMALIIVTWPQWQIWATFVGGGIAGTLPIWLLQYRWVGHLFGLTMAANFFDYGRPESYPVQPYSGVPISPILKIGRLLFHIQPQTITLGAVFMLIIGIFMLIFSLRLPTLRRPLWLGSGLFLTMLGYGAYIMYTLTQGKMLIGLITTFPLMAFVLANVEQSPSKATTHLIYRLVSSTALIFLGVMLAFWPAFGGDQWGARYLLPVYPLLLLSAFYGYTTQIQAANQTYAKQLRLLFITLLGTSFILQISGVRNSLIRHNEDVGIQDTLATLPVELILTNSPFFPSAMSSLDDKMFMYVAGAEGLETLIPRLAQNNISRFALIPLEAIPINMPKQVGDIRINQISNFIYELEIPDP